MRNAATLPETCHRQVLALAVLVVTIAVGCGGSDDSVDGREPEAPTVTGERAERPPTPPNGGKAGSPDGGAGPSDDDTRQDAAPAGDGTNVPGGVPDPGSSEDDEQAIAAVVAGMYDAFGNGDAAGVCGELSENARAQVSGGNPGACEDTLQRLFAVSPGSAGLRRVRATEVQGVQIDGDTATVRVALGAQSAITKLVRENGRWRFASLENPSAQPPE